MDFFAKPYPSTAAVTVRRLVERTLILVVVAASLRFAYLSAVFSLSSSPSTVTRSDSRRSIDFYSSVFHGLIASGYLSLAARCYCIGDGDGDGVAAIEALRAIGVPDAVAGNSFDQIIGGSEYDFVFVDRELERSNEPWKVASKISSVLPRGGIAVVLTSSGGDPYSRYSVKELFHDLHVVQIQDVDASVGANVESKSKAIREFVFKKVVSDDAYELILGDAKVNCAGNMDHKRQLVNLAEPVIVEEPLKPWITLKRNLKNIKYLPSIADISFKKKYVYIDVGARSYGSSIGSWFRKKYPKQNHTFEIYAIEADKAFHDEYNAKKHVHLLPFAAWVRNETLVFEINREHEHKDDSEGRGMGRIRPAGVYGIQVASSNVHTVRGFDFALWMKRTVSKWDYVVMKMDVEGTEFDLIPRLFKTGAFCLVDELFLECHYNRWQKCCPGVRSPKYQNTYSECVKLFTSLREHGVLVHQWW